MFIKRTFDLIISIAALAVLSPVLLIVAVIVKIDSKGPAFLKQVRGGKGKKDFFMYKFRTMRVDTPQLPTVMLKNSEQYITRVGKVLRKLSLDELPQLFNVLKGDMSLIGPRPVIKKEIDLIQLRDRYGANDVRPGITGWAQVNGRDELTNDFKAYYDGEYVKNMSLVFDLKICFYSVYYVVARKGIHEGEIIPEQQEKDA